LEETVKANGITVRLSFNFSWIELGNFRIEYDINFEVFRDLI